MRGACEVSCTSVIALTNSSGTVTNRYKYSAFGDSPSLTGTTHGYTGQRYESESGLYFYKMRYFSPKLGRFLQPDPIGFGDGPNLYTYCQNDGLNRYDPLGLKSPPISEKTSTAIVGGYNPLFDPVRGPEVIKARLRNQLLKDFIAAAAYTPIVVGRIGNASEQGRDAKGLYTSPITGANRSGSTFERQVFLAARNLGMMALGTSEGEPLKLTFGASNVLDSRVYDFGIVIPTTNYVIGIEVKGATEEYSGYQKQFDTVLVPLGVTQGKGAASQYTLIGTVVIKESEL